MSSERVYYYILCEDQKSRDFLRRILKRRHPTLSDRDFAPVGLAAGRGCGIQHVLDGYAAVLDNCRKLSRAWALVVMIDADTTTVDARLGALAKSLRDRDVVSRSVTEPVALLVPKRNIQTWIEHLRTAPPSPVQEDEPYPEFESTGRREHWAPAVDQLVVLLAQGTPWPDCPPALAAALPEFARVP